MSDGSGERCDVVGNDVDDDDKHDVMSDSDISLLPAHAYSTIQLNLLPTMHANGIMNNSLWSLITSAKEVMFLPDFVCLFVCLFVCVSARQLKNFYGRIFLKFSGNVGNGKTTRDSILGVIQKES